VEGWLTCGVSRAAKSGRLLGVALSVVRRKVDRAARGTPTVPPAQQPLEDDGSLSPLPRVSYFGSCLGQKDAPMAWAGAPPSLPKPGCFLKCHCNSCGAPLLVLPASFIVSHDRSLAEVRWCCVSVQSSGPPTPRLLAWGGLCRPGCTVAGFVSEACRELSAAFAGGGSRSAIPFYRKRRAGDVIQQAQQRPRAAVSHAAHRLRKNEKPLRECARNGFGQRPCADAEQATMRPWAFPLPKACGRLGHL